jgi:hypothetical protein
MTSGESKIPPASIFPSIGKNDDLPLALGVGNGCEGLSCEPIFGGELCETV